MAKEEKPGFQPSAGLVRSFEVDESKNIKIRPSWVIAFPFLVVILVVLIYHLVRWIAG